MKREDIEKAAKDYSIGKTYFRRNVLKEVDADNYVLRKGNCSEDFIAGAEWQAKQSLCLGVWIWINEIIMSIAEDIIDGWCCQLCGVYFEEKHGYPVVCESCYNELSEEEKKDYQLATHKEF